MAEINNKIGDPIAGYCKYCGGSGDSSVLSGGGPDAYEVPINCPKCEGTGAHQVLKNEDIKKIFSPCGAGSEQEFLIAVAFARAIEASVLSANAGKVYPIERVLTDAEWLAKNAEDFLSYLSEHSDGEECVINPDESYGDHAHAIRLAIHEFRKRKDRYLDSVAPTQQAIDAGKV